GRFCDRALLLEHGEMVEEGEPVRVGNRYLELNFSEEARAQLLEVEVEEESAEEAPAPAPASVPVEERYGDRRAEILEAWFEHADGRRATSLETGERCAFCARVRFAADVEDPLFGVNLHNGRDDNVLSASNVLGPPSGRFAAADEVVFRIVFDNVFAADRYMATPAVAQAGSGLQWLDRRERFVSV